ncbi:MAG: MFS transporter [Pusillimonas sp.]
MSSVDGLSMPRRLWAVAVISMGVMLSVIDGVLFNVALPTMARDLDVSPAFTIVLVNAHQVAVTVFLLPLSAVGDLLGYRRVFLTGMLLLFAGSVAGLFTDSFGTLALVRVVQGIGSASLMAVGSALVRSVYPARLLGRGIGLNSMVVAASASVGPTLAGLVLKFGSWHWLFALSMPFCVLAFFWGRAVLPDNRRNAGRFDVRDALLNALTVGCVMVAVTGLSQGRLPLLFGAGLLAAGLTIGVVFVRRQLRQERPLLPLDLLRHPLIGLSALTSLTSFIGQMLALVCLPFYLQISLGYDATRTGLLMAAWPLSVMAMAPVWGYVADRYPAGLVGLLGLVVAASGLVVLATLGSSGSLYVLGTCLAVCGLGYGLFQIPNTRTIVESSPRSRSGATGGLIATSRMTGQMLGTVLLAFIFNMTAHRSEETALWVAAMLTLLAAGISSLRLFIRVPAGPDADLSLLKTTKETDNDL